MTAIELAIIMKLIIFYRLENTTMKNKRALDLPAVARKSLTSLRFRKDY